MSAWRRDRTLPLASRVFLPFLAIAGVFVVLRFLSNPYPPSTSTAGTLSGNRVQPFDCYAAPQASPVIAAAVEGVKYPFLFSLADLGALPDKPHKNIVRVLKGKRFRRPDISATVQEVLEGRRRAAGRDGAGLVIDVGANVGMATFAAAAMGFRVVAFEPVFENLQRICDGIYLNRAADRVMVYAAAASDRAGNVTIHKLVGRLDNSAISATGAKLAFKSNEEVAVKVPTVPLDEIIPDNEQVLLLKIDVQGWEHHVLRGARRLLSHPKSKAPYLIYEEDERLLKASNSSASEIRAFLETVGYRHCVMHDTDAHCMKD